MPSQAAVDLSRTRVRAVEIDGTAKSPKVRGFVAADVPPTEPAPEGEPQHGPRYGEALREMANQRRLPRDPSAVALASVDCTFRDLDLPFTTRDQIDKVVKFEAESHLQLVEIDSVVVSYQLLEADGHGGSRLLTTACSKEVVRGVLRDLDGIGIDPHFADLHLTALFTALRATGYLVPPPDAPDGTPPGEAPKGDVVVVLECDADLTHLLVARGDTLIAARAVRLGVAPPKAAAPPAEETEKALPLADKDKDDETLVVVDDLAKEIGATTGGKRAAASDYFSRIKREVQRTTFKLGPAAEHVTKVLLLGTATRDAGFVAHLESTLRTPVEVAKPFDRVECHLDPEALAAANAEGAAALGVGLRLLGDESGSRVDFRQEEVRYARRFDQVKVALSCAAIVALVCVALICIEQVKLYKTAEVSRLNAALAVVGEYSAYRPEGDALQKQLRTGASPVVVAGQAVDELRKHRKGLEDDLGRSGTIPRLTSGLDYLNAVILSIDKAKEKIGRIEITSIDLNVGRNNGKNPQLKLKLLLNGPDKVDALLAALRSCPAVQQNGVKNPTTNLYKDGRIEVTSLDVDLVPEYVARRVVAKGGASK
jgi:Tfp pilus assembly PilM family ATPase